MLRTWIFFVFLMLSSTLMAGNQAILEELDAAIAERDEFILAKENRIKKLKLQIQEEHDSATILKTLDDLYNEYYVFKFDSAKACADKGLALAVAFKNSHYTTLFTIHRSEILAIGGLYSEARANLEAVDANKLDSNLRFKYHLALFLLYTYWTNYCNDHYYSPLYRAKADSCLIQGFKDINPRDPFYDYYMGEYCVYIKKDSREARKHYYRVLEKASEASRFYAMASNALAGNYLVDGNEEKYVEFLAKAAMSDLKCSTMENMALQSLAVRLFQNGEEHIERAERYINVSMEDAKFYNNRLRILEISRILPQIMTTYQDVTERQNRHLRYSISFISLLVVVLLFTAYFIYRQNRKLNIRRHELAESNNQLTDLNNQLQELNQRLVYTNKHRERLASIYIDLCAKYIDKFAKYQTLVKRKIKAHQEQELLQTISSTRISEEDAATFLNRFDKAFLELYPTFVEEFNALLTEDGRILQKSPHTLSTELRTYALIRLGVKSTADIAGLLFLSNQTIYNCRSVTKNKAINKETFDDDVMRLCTVIR
jgi:cytochrome oxidase assembly protein ShyY1